MKNDKIAVIAPCRRDPSARRQVSFPPGGPNSSLTNTVVDVAVLNAKGDLASYQFDTSLNQTCLGDQPKTGFSNSELIISTDEYCGPNTDQYEGAIVLAVNKSQLVAESPSVSEDLFGPVSLAGSPATQARLLLGMYPWKGYTLVEEDACLKLGWKDLSLLTASAWEPADDDAAAAAAPTTRHGSQET